MEWTDTVEHYFKRTYLDRNRGFEPVDVTHRKFPEQPPYIPHRGTKRSAGYDIYATVDIRLQPGESTKFATDIKAYMLDDEVLMVYPRSSVGIKEIMITNTVGIVDSDYYSNVKNDGNITIFLKNIGTEEFVASKGDRIAQGIFTKYLLADGDNFEDGEERAGGYGHTGN